MGYVCPCLKDSNKERKTSQLLRQLYWTMERREEEEACRLRDEGGELLITETDETGGRGGGRARFLQGERTTRAEGRAGAQRPCQEGSSWGYEVHLTGTRPARGSRGCLVAINGHVDRVLTQGLTGGRSGAVSRSRSRWTLLKVAVWLLLQLQQWEGEVAQQDVTDL